jgi:hypothetical protein
MTKDPVSITDARVKAIKTAADWVEGADWDQFWGEELANDAFCNDQLAAILTQAKREVAAAIRRIRRV